MADHADPDGGTPTQQDNVPCQTTNIIQGLPQNMKKVQALIQTPTFPDPEPVE